MIRPCSLFLALALALAACGSDAAAPRPQRPREAVRLANSSGDQQTGYTGMALELNASVTAMDNSGRGVEGVLVRFSPAGGGWVTETDVITDGNGVASTTWYLGPNPGGDNFLFASSPAGNTGFRAHSSPLTVGETYRSKSGLVEFTMGSVPLILAASHGGAVEPAGIPVRTNGNVTPDEGTAELVAEVAQQLRARGATPYVLISRVHRSRMDADASLATGVQGSRQAEQAWREYHGFLAAARQYIQTRNERGLLVDVHGHAGSNAVELGYLLSPADLAQPDELLNDPAVERRSSIRAVATDNQSAFSWIVRGGGSLGALLAARGVDALPSPVAPTAGAQYSGGGYTTQVYGSRDNGFVSAIYLQTPAALRDTPQHRSAFAAMLVPALNDYFLSYYRGEALVTR